MFVRLLSVLAVAAAVMMPAPAATDTSSLKAYLKSCQTDSKGCHSVTLSAVISARSASYGCIPKDVSDETASNKVLDWLKDKAADDPKYQSETLPDLMWTAIDEVWPCKKE